jgi:hypothetical protein
MPSKPLQGIKHIGPSFARMARKYFSIYGAERGT